MLGAPYIFYVYFLFATYIHNNVISRKLRYSDDLGYMHTHKNSICLADRILYDAKDSRTKNDGRTSDRNLHITSKYAQAKLSSITFMFYLSEHKIQFQNIFWPFFMRTFSDGSIYVNCEVVG